MLNFYRLPQDFLKFSGSERLDLINRLSTNGVNTLEKFHSVKTVLTSDKGRFIDLLQLYSLGETVFCTCSFQNSANVISHLDKYTIMDDFTAENLSGTHETILFFGDDASAFINKITGVDIAALTENSFTVTSDHDAIIQLNDDAFGGVKFIFAVNDKEYWSEMLFADENLSEFGLKELSESEFETKRIELGIPKFGAEMSDLTNPLECGMNKYVSFTKGCYIGQEVIARLDAYDKISKHLVGLKIKSPNKIDLSSAGKITFDGKECGFVTSAAYSDAFGSIALGFVKTIFLDYDKNYIIKNNESGLECTITRLPFTQ